MTTRILLTTTSYQDTPGPHHELLESRGFEIVRERGPLPEAAMLALAGEFDAFLCGDDAITQAVIEKSAPRLKVISKYGIGLDKIDVAYATTQKLPVLNTPGVNHTTVAEHTFGLLLSLTKKIQENAVEVKEGKWVAGWKKPVGHEILGSTMGIIGLGRIGKEVATRARAFGMSVIAYDPYFDESFAAEHGVTRCETMDDVLLGANVVSLHCFLDKNTHGMINAEKIAEMKDGVIVLNCARGELVDTNDIAAALASGKVGGYGADVLDEEPPAANHPLFTAPNCIITSHIASRTYESVERQALRATHNLINYLKGDPDFIQANKF
ncbi:MAG: phosphoglycerate dehydrogenase [Verrucomicrobiales bacterium]|jgi:D-3-phosphoglycerate dehydrogenase / 2-oxoglutarate reductase|nr:phosphoglycerate dehydrogenase [Verrucomicrobiales bacterium]MDP5006591.1 phosphoglycerate dehydrogenase [Verrucomicrobiales bacterium]